jgi:hypothetical protein
MVWWIGLEALTFEQLASVHALREDSRQTALPFQTESLDLNVKAEGHRIVAQVLSAIGARSGSNTITPQWSSRVPASHEPASMSRANRLDKLG